MTRQVMWRTKFYITTFICVLGISFITMINHKVSGVFWKHNVKLLNSEICYQLVVVSKILSSLAMF